MNVPSAYHSADGAAAGAHGENEGQLVHIASNAFVNYEGHSQKHQKINGAGEESPQKPFHLGSLPGQYAADEAGDNVNDVDSQVYLTFTQVKLIEAECQNQQKNGGEYVGGKNGADQNPQTGLSHIDSL